MNGAPPPLSVVIPTVGERAGLLRASVERLLGDAATGEVIVVVDRRGAVAATVAALPADPRVVVIEAGDGQASPSDRGQRARDAGAERARFEVVLALDDDVEPAEGLAGGHARAHAEDGACLVVGYMPVVQDAWEPPASSAVGGLYSEAYEHTCARYETDADSVLLALWGGHFSLRRGDWLRAVAAAAPVAAGYHVDREFGLRLRACGVRGVFMRDLVAAHHYRRSLAELAGDARAAGAGTARLHAAYPAFVEMPPLRRPVRAVVSAGVRGRLGPAISRALVLAGRAAESAGPAALARGCAKLIWAIGFAQGVGDASRSTSPATRRSAGS